VVLWRSQKPEYFDTPDTSKLTDEQFSIVDRRLRESNRRAINNLPAELKQLNAAPLKDDEMDALGRVLGGSGNWEDRSLLEAAALRQGIALHLDVPAVDEHVTV
jgi:hypothetical protein